jgi:hypothetical protein
MSINPAKASDIIGQPLAKGQFTVEFGLNVSGDQFLFLEAVNHRILECGQITALCLERILNIVGSKTSQAGQADHMCGIPVRMLVMN